MFGPSPCPAHYDWHLATTPSADFCLLTIRVTPERAIGFHLVCSLRTMTSEDRGTCIPEPDWLLGRSHGKQTFTLRIHASCKSPASASCLRVQIFDFHPQIRT